LTTSFAKPYDDAIFEIDAAISAAATTVTVKVNTKIPAGATTIFAALVTRATFGDKGIGTVEIKELVTITNVSGTGEVDFTITRGPSPLPFSKNDIIRVDFNSQWLTEIHNVLDGTDLLSIGALTVTGDFLVIGAAAALSSFNVGFSNFLTVANLDSSNSASDAVIRLTTTFSTGGNPVVSWGISGAQSFQMGIDNSDSDKFVGSVGVTLGTANWLEVTAGGAVTLPNALATGALTVTGLMQSTTAGIGIAHTDGTLHVHTASCGAQSAPAAADDLVVENNASGGMTILTPDAASSEIVFGSPSRQTGAFIDWRFGNLAWQIGAATAGAKVEIFSGNGVLAMTLNSTQDVEIPSGNLTVAGILTAGSGPVVLTTAAGLLRHQAIDQAIAGANITNTGGVLSVHAQSHTVASHSDTTATGANLNTLTNNSMADTLHRHSELAASDGSPDPVISVSADGETVTVGQAAAIRGHLFLNDGAGGNTASYITFTSRNGTERTLWIEDDGTLKIHTKAPVLNADGDVVGAQT